MSKKRPDLTITETSTTKKTFEELIIEYLLKQFAKEKCVNDLQN